MPAPARTAIVLLLGLSLEAAVPLVARAQGTAPAQGVVTPIPQPVAPGGPPAPRPQDLGDGRPRQDTGGGAANTAPETTSSLPLPQPGQADPPAKQSQ